MPISENRLLCKSTNKFRPLNMTSFSAVAAVPSPSSSSNQLHLVLRAAAPLSSAQPTLSTMPTHLSSQNEENNTQKVLAMPSRGQQSAESNAKSPLSESRCAADNRNEARRFVSPADFFSRQSLNASQMAGRPNTRHRFQQQNALFDDLLLAESERDGVQTTLTIRGTATATNLSH
uniref:Uncharacterized protein n=1 Tax=Globodera rostochiensis TaxID=31243 RepID=A0A914H3N0_GLORO